MEALGVRGLDRAATAAHRGVEVGESQRERRSVRAVAEGQGAHVVDEVALDVVYQLGAGPGGRADVKLRVAGWLNG